MAAYILVVIVSLSACSPMVCYTKYIQLSGWATIANSQANFVVSHTSIGVASFLNISSGAGDSNRDAREAEKDEVQEVHGRYSCRILESSRQISR